MEPNSRSMPVLKDQDRVGDPIRFLNGNFFCKVSAADTHGEICVFDTVRTVRGGPPLHFHHAQDEWFFVTEGEFDIQIGDAVHRLREGDAVLGPRLVPHAFVNITETGRLLVMFSPAGTMETFFREGSRRGPLSATEFASLSEEHGMTVVGPPLSTLE